MLLTSTLTDSVVGPREAQGLPQPLVASKPDPSGLLSACPQTQA